MKMKLFTICLLLLATITARTMAQGEDITEETTIAPDPTTDGPTTVPPVSETTVDSTVPSGETTSEPITTADDTTLGTTVSSNGTPGATTVSTTTPTTTAAPNVTNVNPLQCYSCSDADCNEKVVVKCAENGTAPVTMATNIKAYACYSIKVTVNDTQRDKLGCIGIPEGESACEAVREELQLTTNDSSDECKACQEDTCNGCKMTKLSVVALFCLILTKVLI